MPDKHRVGEQDECTGIDQRQTRGRPDSRQRDFQALQVPETIGDQQRATDSGKDLPEIIDNVLVEKVVQLANHEDQREPAEEEGQRPLRMAVPGNPAH